MNELFLWSEKYRPQTIEDTILPVDNKNSDVDIEVDEE